MSDDGTPSAAAKAPTQREDEDDHDLLTYGEVGARLSEELETQRALVATLEASGDPELESARMRLTVLEEAIERNRSDRRGSEVYERWFGDRGSASSA
jgi:hypothetical protein